MKRRHAMDEPVQPRPTAQIIQFRPRLVARPRPAHTTAFTPDPPLPLVIGKAWYHDDAIAADAHTTDNPAAKTSPGIKRDRPTDKQAGE